MQRLLLSDFTAATRLTYMEATAPCQATTNTGCNVSGDIATRHKYHNWERHRSSKHSEYTLNFTFVRLVSPLAFAITDVARRLAIIVVGAAIFRKRLTPLNGAGVALALGGVLCFLAATSEAPRKRHRHAK